MDLTCQLRMVESIPLAGAEARWPADFVIVTVPLTVLRIDLKKEVNLRWGGYGGDMGTRPELGTLCGGLAFLVWQGERGLSARLCVYIV